MEATTTQAEIREILLEMLVDRHDEVGRLAPDAPIVLSLALDSLDAVDLAMELKRRFRVDLTEADTLNATLEVLARRIDELRPRT
jgi:acyl carrier protein